MDYTGSIGYNVLKALADLLALMVLKTKHYVQYAKHSATELKEVKLVDDELFVLHDLFPSSQMHPSHKPYEIISNRLKKERTLKKSILLTSEDIVGLAICQLLKIHHYFVVWQLLHF